MVRGGAGSAIRSNGTPRRRSPALSTGVAVLYGADIDGDIAEFGTMTGATARGLARAIATCDATLTQAIAVYGSRPRTLHLFDSFVGLPATDNPIDASAPHVQDGAWMPGACCGLEPDALLAETTAFLAAERVRIHAGWFSETVPALPLDTRFALIHIDCDLYSSAMDALSGLLDRGLIARGAYVFFDDWNCNRADPNLGERRAWRECCERYGIVASDQGAYGVFSRCFIVHDYRRAPDPTG